jgi:hypothetical protein
MVKIAKKKQNAKTIESTSSTYPPVATPLNQIPGVYGGAPAFKPSIFKTGLGKSADRFLEYVANQIQLINNSKIFAGLMIIILNIASRFVQINLSKTMEAYLKYTFSKQILVFAITWVGTRDIYIAFLITILFIVCSEYLFNENSRLCCLPESFTDYHVSLLDKVSNEEIKHAEDILEKAKNQGKELGWKKVNTENSPTKSE